MPRRLVMFAAVALPLGGCVQYKSITPPTVGAPPRPLPEVVTVTTRDSVHYRLEDARFRDDTLLGYRTGGHRTLARIPVSDIARMEGRTSTVESNVSGGLAVIAVSLAILVPLLFILYSPST